MSKTAHRIYITLMAFTVVVVLGLLAYDGYEYYNTSQEERFYHPDHTSLKPSGIWGHGFGIIGSMFMIIGVSAYMIRKRSRAMARMGKLKHWLEFHIFLCTLGPILVLFHTSFKFGGLVAISFWSMVAVFLSGIIGRFIYIQIPRTIEGRELSLNEVKGLRRDIGEIIRNIYHLDRESSEMIVESTRNTTKPEQGTATKGFFKNYLDDQKILKKIKTILKKNNLSRIEIHDVMKLIRNEITLNRKIGRLQLMQDLFKYWHVAHLPFALVMLIIMVIHVVVTIVFGYKWIF
jgi:hypothetical protein